MENISGDTIIGKYNGSDCTVRHMWYISAMQRHFPPLLLCFTDGSNNFLKISSNGGGVDVYVGDGGSADVQTQEGKFRWWEAVKCTSDIQCLFLPFSAPLRRRVRACAVLAERWRGSPWGAGARRPRGCSAQSRK